MKAPSLAAKVAFCADKAPTVDLLAATLLERLTYLRLLLFLFAERLLLFLLTERLLLGIVII